MPNPDTWLEGEPGLGEILVDPIVRLVMRRDGLDPRQVRDAIERGRMALRGVGTRPGKVTQSMPLVTVPPKSEAGPAAAARRSAPCATCGR